MDNILTVMNKTVPLYDIVYAEDFSLLKDELIKHCESTQKVCIVTDSNVEGYYLSSLKESIAGVFSSVCSFSFPAGEENKKLSTVENLYRFLIQKSFTRNDLLIALGGGVVGDITGFAAATYERGIRFVQIPTSLLAMADSSIGGKTGVDLDGLKNMVGAFYNPILVYINTSVLKTLPDRQYFAGFAEIMKAAIIKDASFYSSLIEDMYEICEKKNDTLIKMLLVANKIKKDIVEKDPKEKGERALLNFGHTIGHAIEKQKMGELFHGECVALGSIAAAFISYKRNLLSKDEYYEIRDMFVPFYLPISVDLLDIPRMISDIHHDKKCTDTGIRFILIKKIGKALIVDDVSDEEIIEAINEINFSEEDLKE